MTTEKRQLYPLKFRPILKSVIWGGSDITKFKNIEPPQSGIGESWEISGVPGDVSVIANGDFTGTSLIDLLSIVKEELVGKTIYEKFGNKFPLLIKFIDAQKDLSIQVHPNDQLAKERHNSFGKTEMWYVVKATPEAFLYTGFEEELTSDKYEESIKNNTFTSKLKKYNVREGDVFFLPAGRVHAIGSGCFIAEIQQTSDITYRIYDYNRKDKDGKGRELHTELAKDAIDFNVYDTYKTEYNKVINQPVELVSSPYFTTNLLELNRPLDRDYSQKDSFVIYMCLEGSLRLEDNKNNNINLQQGESLLIPAVTNSVRIEPIENCKILEVFAV